MDKLLKYFPIVKVEEGVNGSPHMVWGLVTSETPDHEKEICDYPTAKKSIKAWSDDQLAKTLAAGQDPSLGNMRVMHQLDIGGKAIKIEYKDDSKQIWVGSEPADADVWHLLKGGFLTSHSIGGGYLWKRDEGEYVRYGPSISEISYVDKGSNPDSAFSYVKADGTTELRKFAKPGPEEEAILRKLKDDSIASLSVDINRIVKALSDSLSTRPAKTIKEKTESVEYSATGANMKPEEIKKCAAALGITQEEFTKQFVEGDALNKGAKGMAALHSHLETAMAHHEAMSKAHDAMGAMHDKMGTHLGKCMKAAKDVMGSESESEKAFKSLMDELKAAAAPAAPKPDTKNVDLDVVVKAAVDAATKDLMEKVKKLEDAPAPSGIHLFSVNRESEVKKALEASDPLPV